MTDNSTKYPDLDINNTICKWVGVGNITVPLVRLNPTVGTFQVLNGVRVNGLTITARSTTASFENALQIKATNFSLNDITVFCPDTLTQVTAAFIEAIEVLDSSKGIVSNINYLTDVPVAGAGTSWAVNVENSSNITVRDVTTDNAGVILRTGTSSTVVSQVNASASKTAVSDIPTTNTIGSDITNLMP